jgi:hypothetical protein
VSRPIRITSFDRSGIELRDLSDLQDLKARAATPDMLANSFCVALLAPQLITDTLITDYFFVPRPQSRPPVTGLRPLFVFPANTCATS